MQRRRREGQADGGGNQTQMEISVQLEFPNFGQLYLTAILHNSHPKMMLNLYFQFFSLFFSLYSFFSTDIIGWSVQKQTLLKACSPGAFKCLSPAGSVQCKGSKLPSLCSLKRVSTQTNSISATQNQTVLPALHILQTHLLPHTLRKFLGFPAAFASTCNRTVPWSALPRVSCPDPTVPGGSRCGHNSPTLPFQRWAWLKSHSAFSRAHKNKQNKSYSTHCDKTRLHPCNHKCISLLYLHIPTPT